jgi:hypothetical protein
MSRVQIHCYGCDATVPVATASSAEDLSRAGWSLARGETYCPACAPAVPPAPEAPAGPDDGAISADREAAAIAASADIAMRSRPARSASRTLARIRRPRLGRGREKRAAQRRRPRLRTVAARVATTLQAPLRRPRAPVTSHSKVSSLTIVLFCLAAALTLGTLGSNVFAVRLPGVIFSFAAGMSWLRDLRSAT